MINPTMPASVKSVFSQFPTQDGKSLLALRSLIFDVASHNAIIAPIQETLRWGQPAYVCKTGTTLRLGVPKSGGYAIYAPCQSTVIADFAALFPTDFRIDGNRGVLFDTGSPIDANKLHLLISAALTYKIRSKLAG